MHGPQRHRGTGRQFLRWNVAEQLAHLRQRLLWIDITHDHHDGRIGCVPGAIELLEHLRGRLVERRTGAQRIMLVGCARKGDGSELGVQQIGGIGYVLRHLLLDRAALLIPSLHRVIYSLHAQRLDVQRHAQIIGRHREQVLRDALARVGIEIAAHNRADVCQLVGRQARAAAKHHVLLRVRQSRKTSRRLVRSHQIVDRDRHHGSELVAHDDHLQAVVERRAHDLRLWTKRRLGCGARHRGGGGGDNQARKPAGGPEC